MTNSKLRFNEQDEFGNLGVRTKVSGITGFFIRGSGGLIRTEKQATIVMIIMIIVCVVLVFWLKPKSVSEQDRTDIIKIPEGKTVEYPESGPPRISQ
jgi:hypothetical protein